jgi:hypothetical protein
MVAQRSVCLRRLGGDRAGEVRFGRFLGNDKVTVERLIAGWSEQTVGAVAGRHVLAIQDTSDVLIATTQDHPPVKPGDGVWAKSAKAQGMAC